VLREKAVFWRFSMIKSQHCKRGEGERGRVQCSLMSDHDGTSCFEATQTCKSKAGAILLDHYH